MSVFVRRSFALGTSLCLLLTLTAASVGVSLGRSPTSTTVSGIDVDASTIPELQALMDAHRLSSTQVSMRTPGPPGTLKA